jgi:hypothetical protein
MALPERPDPLAAAAARSVVDAGGPAVEAVIFFGSRKTRAQPDDFSPWDFFVIVSDYRSFYRSLRQARVLRRWPHFAAALNAVMPPSVVALRAPNPRGGPSLPIKCPVISRRHFRRDTSVRRRDHFLIGRLFQPVEIVYAASPAAAEETLDALARASVLTYHWGRASLPPRFDVSEYCRTLLRVSYAAEIRPEPSGRAGRLWGVQQPVLRPVFDTLLNELCAAGDLQEPAPGVFTLARPAGALERWRLAAYFQWSLVRATARWAKHVVTYDDWLEFLLRKVRRHSGEDIVLTPRERRLPLVFLWPRVFRYLRNKDAQSSPP